MMRSIPWLRHTQIATRDHKARRNMKNMRCFLSFAGVLNIQSGWDTRISGIARAWVNAAAIAADGSVFLIGIGQEEKFDFDSVVVHLNSSGEFLWEWKVCGVCPAVWFRSRLLPPTHHNFDVSGFLWPRLLGSTVLCRRWRDRKG